MPCWRNRISEMGIACQNWLTWFCMIAMYRPVIWTTFNMMWDFPFRVLFKSWILILSVVCFSWRRTIWTRQILIIKPNLNQVRVMSYMGFESWINQPFQIRNKHIWNHRVIKDSLQIIIDKFRLPSKWSRKLHQFTDSNWMNWKPRLKLFS